MQHRLHGVEQREHATVQQLEAQMHASQRLTGVRESELAERVARQDMQMQRMMDEEAQATMAFAAAQRELQRMADGESRAAMAVRPLQHETVHKAGLLGEQARTVYQMYQQECAAFAHLQEQASTQRQPCSAVAQRM